MEFKHIPERPEATARLKARITERLLHNIDELKSGIEKDMPEFLIARIIAQIYRRGLVLCGKHLTDVMGEEAVENARRTHAVCNTCDNDVAPMTSHYPLCEMCDAHFAAEAEMIDNELTGDAP